MIYHSHKLIFLVSKKTLLSKFGNDGANDGSKFLVPAGIGNHVADRKVPAPARIVPAFWRTCYFIGDHKRKRRVVRRVKTKKPGKEKKLQKNRHRLPVNGGEREESIHSSIYIYLAACFFSRASPV